MATEKQANELRKALCNLKEQGEIMEEYVREFAPLVRAKYEALVKAGFAEAEALELCKGSLFNLG